MTEIFENFYMGPLAPVGADGSFSIRYPEGSELPAVLMGPVQDSVLNVTDFPGCGLVASDPAVTTTIVLFELVGVPGIGLVTAVGTTFALSTAEALPAAPTGEDYLAARIQTWMYVSGPTSLVTEPFTCAITGPDEPTISVSASLATGWNQLEWTVDTDDTGGILGFNLNNTTAEELHALSYVPLSTP